MSIEETWIARRKLLIAAGIAPLAIVAGQALASPPAAACADPAKLSLTQRSRRRSLGYVEPSTEPTKKCGGCAFFAAAAAGCGTCQLMSGGPVTATGVCNSFAPKAK